MVLTADVGPADAVLGSGHAIDSSWEETDAGLLACRETLQSLEARFGFALPVTWFIRADELIERQFGDRCAIFARFAELVRSAASNGHEIGWLPQVYAGTSEQPGAINYDDLSATHVALERVGVAVRSVRMGNCFHDDRTMALLAALGIANDSSAVPGRTKVDLGWRMDWSSTPMAPYRPSATDYRIPGDPSLDLIEVPLTVRPLKAPYDAAPLLRYVNPCMHHEFFGQNLREVVDTAGYLLCIFHPDEAVAPRHGRGHPLVAYSRQELERNIRHLVSIANDAGRTISFQTLGQFAASLRLQPRLD